MPNRAVVEAVRAKFTKKNGELKRLKKPPKWLFPESAEREYTRELYQLTFLLRMQIIEKLLPAIPSLLRQATQNYPDPIDQNDRHDDFVDDLNGIMRVIALAILPKQTETIAEAARVGFQIALYNSGQFTKITNSVLGIDIFQDQPWLRPQLELFANQNAQLIESLTETQIDRVSGMVQRGLQEGSTYETIAEDIQTSFGICRRHAKLIARDQTTKLNGSLTKLRQQELGITEYVWRTGNDERVRPSHAVLEGKICRWDDPTVYRNPGSDKWLKKSSIGGDQVQTSQAVNCRCYPEPIIAGILEVLD